MSSILIKNGKVVTLGEQNKIIDNGFVLIRDGIIKEVGSGSPKTDIFGAEIIDAEGKLIMPGFINQHMHFYSTFARGLCPKQPPAANFLEILERLWWPLDKALNKDDIYYSTIIPAINGIKKGVTTFFDHHESQGYQLGSLDIIEKALRDVGVRANLSLGSSDRYGKGSDGVEENARFIDKIQNINKKGDELITAMFGFHAMFTVEDDTMYASSEAAKQFNTGIHVHVAEGTVDNEVNLKKYNKTAIQRLYDSGCLGEKTTIIHGIYLSEKEMEFISDTNTPVVHVPQSNMNNAVGVAPVLEMMDKNILVGIGTDGMSPGVLDDVRVANILHKLNKKDPRVFFVESCKLLLENNSKIASRHFTNKIGVLEENAVGDVIIVDYDPPTPLEENTFLGHFLFGICEARVDSTIVKGKPVMRKGIILHLDEAEINAKSREQAKDFWKRF